MNKISQTIILLLLPYLLWAKKDDGRIQPTAIEPLNLSTTGLGLNSSNYALMGVSAGLVLTLRTYKNKGSKALVSLSQYRKITPHSYIGLSLAAHQQHGIWQYYYTNGGLFSMQFENRGVFNRTCVTLAAEFRTNVRIKGNLAYYVLFGAGGTFYHQVTQYYRDYYLAGYSNGVNRYGPTTRFTVNKVIPNIQLSPLCALYGGGAWKCFLEMGFGYKGLINGGVIYSFN